MRTIWISILLALVTAGATAQVTCGDCDMQGNGVTILDALVGAQAAAGISPPLPLSATQAIVCDVNSSGDVTVIDALLMAQDAAGITVALSCPAPPGPSATKLYVVSGSTVEVVDLTLGTTTATLPLPSLGFGVTIDDMGSMVYASGGDTLVEIDTSTDTIARTLTLGRSTARKVAVIGPFAYVVHWSTSGPGALERVDLSTGSSTALTVDQAGWEVTASLAGDAIYIGHIGAIDQVTRVDVATFAITMTMPLGNNPIAIEENPVTGEIYVAARDDSFGTSTSDLHALDPTTLAVQSSFPVNDAFGLAVHPGGGVLYSASNNQQGLPTPPYHVQKVDIASGSVLNPTIGPIGGQPWYFALDAAGTFLFTCDNASDQISEVDTGTDTVSRTFPLAADPRDIVVK